MIRNFSQIARAAGVLSLGAVFVAGAPALQAQAAPELEFHSGAAGGAFLPYAEGIAAGHHRIGCRHGCSG